jgi:hypothetical protein
MSTFEDLFKEQNETLWEHYSSRGLAIKLRILKTAEEVKKDSNYHNICLYNNSVEFYLGKDNPLCKTCNFLSENYDNLNVKEEIGELEKKYFERYKEEFKL